MRHETAVVLRGGQESWGAVAGDGVIDLGKALGGRYPALQDFIASDDYARRDAIVAGLKADYPLSGIRFLPVIPKAEKIICLVRNYMDHHQEVLAAGLQRELSKFPPIFLRVWRSQVGHDEPIVRPKVSHELDWEASSPSSSARAAGTSPRRTRSPTSRATPATTT